MPFTFSHPAIILPLTKINKKYISATALVAGSMAPDFEYFINMRMIQRHGHTISGMFYYDLPLAILLCFVFHLFIRDALIKYTPIPFKKQLNNYYNFDWLTRFKKYYLTIIISALIGVCSHLFWDSFTHANRYFVELIPFLRESSSVLGYTFSNYTCAQYISSLIGALAIVFTVFDLKNLSAHQFKFKEIFIYWMFVFLIVVTIVLIRNVTNLGMLIATGISGTLIGLGIAGKIMLILKPRNEIFNQGNHQEF
ncbi:DUF4184 family protein [Paracrocinitomix mangrovi]|uniref:DUF4184 family protein n=1 Tax=Paracrocinitomix mangrovi TaxID=2862509 RepID=UPI001C8DE532|nr:DUF4184 family protein [Paracrocinitomix mangrovi]UKN01443.1 DUF4184 family protein [Paracrocinitomix mangrovi]